MTTIYKEAEALRNVGRSLEAASEYIKIAEVIGDSNIRAEGYHMAATSLKEARRYKEAKENFEKAIEIYKDINKFNLARALRDFADQLTDEGKLEEAGSNFKKSEELLKNEDIGELAITQIKYAACLQLSGDPTSASSKLSLALSNVKKSSNPFYLATAYFYASKVFMERQDYTAALDLLMSALGALELDEHSHGKRRAEIALAIESCLKELGNLELASKASQKALYHLESLDEATRKKVLSSI